MDFNVNVNVKLGLDRESVKFAWRLIRAAIADESTEKDSPAVTKMGDTATMAVVTPISVATEIPAPVTEPIKDEPSDLPFDNDANSEAETKPLPITVVWTPEDARKARRKKMEEIEAAVAPEDRDDVHKQMVKITKIYLQSAAYKHENRDAKGNALNKDGAVLKKLEELDSDEILRFMYLCESMFYSAEDNKVYPFEGLDEVLGACKDWSQVERDFIKTYDKK